MSDTLKEAAEKNKIIEITSGSHLYGTSTPESDKDFVGIFMPPKEYVYGLKYVPEIDLSIEDKEEDGKNSKDAIDRKLYEFRKFINLALGSNPNIIEILFVNDDNVVFINEVGEALLDIRHAFLSKMAVPKFIGYASSQKHKMRIRRDHFNVLREAYKILCKYDDKVVMAQVLEQGYGYFDPEESSSPLPLPIFTKKESGFHIHVGDLCFEPGLYVKKVRKLIKERLDKVTNRSELVLKHGYDTKFASHLIRLLHEGLDILKNGELVFPLPQAEEILGIKKGSMNLKEVLEYAEELEDQLRETEKKTSLPKTPNYKLVEKFTISQMEAFLR